MHEAGDFRRGLATDEADVRAEAEFAGHAAELRLQRAAADHHEFTRLGGVAAEARVRADEQERVLHWQEVADVKNHLRVGGQAEFVARGLRVSGAEGGGVHAVVDWAQLHEGHAGLVEARREIAAARDGGSGMCR